MKTHTDLHARYTALFNDTLQAYSDITEGKKHNLAGFEVKPGIDIYAALDVGGADLEYVPFVDDKTGESFEVIVLAIISGAVVCVDATKMNTIKTLWIGNIQSVLDILNLIRRIENQGLENNKLH